VQHFFFLETHSYVLSFYVLPAIFPYLVALYFDRDLEGTRGGHAKIFIKSKHAFWLLFCLIFHLPRLTMLT